MLKRLLPALTVLLLPLTARAALNPELDKKYQLQVVVKCGTHNWLGGQFRADLRSDLAGILADALGGMADVTVVDLKAVPPAQWQPLWRDVAARGFSALDVPQPLTGGKTHFLHVDYVNGHYELQARQSDGMTGLAGAVRGDRRPGPAAAGGRARPAAHRAAAGVPVPALRPEGGAARRGAQPRPPGPLRVEEAVRELRVHQGGVRQRRHRPDAGAGVRRPA